MSKSDYRPPYMRWHEEAFWSDPIVNRQMNWLQRHLYRTLLQAAFFCETRPYLPGEEKTLAMLADAESVEVWRANAEVILQKFEHFTDENGTVLWRNKRLDAEWVELIASLEQKKSAGVASAKARAKRHADPGQRGLNGRGTDVERTINDAGTLPIKSKLKTVKLNQKEKGTDSASAANSVSVSSPIGESVSVSAGAAEELMEIWTYTRLDDGEDHGSHDPSPFIRLLAEGETVEMVRRVLWFRARSNYWGRPGKGQLRSAEDFRRAYFTIKEQMLKYEAKQSTSAEEMGGDPVTMNGADDEVVPPTVQEFEMEDFG